MSQASILKILGQASIAVIVTRLQVTDVCRWLVLECSLIGWQVSPGISSVWQPHLLGVVCMVHDGFLVQSQNVQP